MRLIAHHILACHAKGCTSNNFPLKFSDVESQNAEAEFSPDFLKGFYPKIEWNVLITTAKEKFIKFGEVSLPEEQPNLEDLDEETLKKIHHVLLEIDVITGKMSCPNCGHIYPIMSGIPNMLLAEHEIA
ncbi:hypothetical protein Clacol_000415 [Clathrus columnatus]|uniref:Multifunctional methyltransferase subunit TRM112-like protein n=1 Tax=Clathrus columnatus TaxID=1419009 RepID=A0AAV4ZX42_9AGAM|nr:hypothetical protein Clacol_000415 [Clathrus columnatus]